MTIKESLKNWKEGTYGKSVAKFPERKKRFKTSFNQEIDPVYVPGFGDENDMETRGLRSEYPLT